jgi:hypothetical protein
MDQAWRLNRNPDELKILALTFPQITTSKSQDFTGTIEDIGSDSKNEENGYRSSNILYFTE